MERSFLSGCRKSRAKELLGTANEELTALKRSRPDRGIQRPIYAARSVEPQDISCADMLSIGYVSSLTVLRNAGGALLEA